MVLSGHLGCPQAGTKGGKATHTWQVGPGVLQKGPGSCVKLKGHQVSVPAGRWRSVDINGHQRRSVPMSKAQQLKERPLTKPKGLALSQSAARKPRRHQATGPQRAGVRIRKRLSPRHTAACGRLCGLPGGSPPGSVGPGRLLSHRQPSCLWSDNKAVFWPLLLPPPQ